MSKHSKPSDNPIPSKGGKPVSASSASGLKAVSPASRGSRSIAPKKEAPWTEVANFVVTFERRESETGAGAERRITAHKMQDDGITAKWTGVAQQPMCEWIADHVGDWADAGPPERVTTEADSSTAATMEPDIAATGLTLAIGQLRAVATADHESAESGEHGQDSRSSFKGGEAFNLEALVEISGLRRAGAARVPPCSVQFFSRNTVTKERSRLGEASIMGLGSAQGQSSYRAILPSVRLAPGSYRLESVVTLMGRQPKLAYGQVPLLQVL